MRFGKKLAVSLFLSAGMTASSLSQTNQAFQNSHDLSFYGNYNPTTVYSSGNVVTTSSASYVSLVDANVGNSVTNPIYWQLMSNVGGVVVPIATASVPGIVTTSQFEPAGLSAIDLGLISTAQSTANMAMTNASNAQTTATNATNGSLKISNNLLDLTNVSAARTNLGLGTASTMNSTSFDASGAATVAVNNEVTARNGAISSAVAPLATTASVTSATSASAMATTIQAQTGCSTAGYVWIPASNTCTNSAPATSLRSGTATNTDLAGEFFFTSTKTATYTFLGSYTTTPEIYLQCWMNCNGNTPWLVAVGVTGFTITFATPITGKVSYAIIGRN